AVDQRRRCSSSGSSRKLWGRPVARFSVGAASQAAWPRSCCSAPRQTSSHGSTGPKRALPQARANCPETQAWAGCAITSSPAGSARCSTDHHLRRWGHLTPAALSFVPDRPVVALAARPAAGTRPDRTLIGPASAGWGWCVHIDLFGLLVW